MNLVDCDAPEPKVRRSGKTDFVSRTTKMYRAMGYTLVSWSHFGIDGFRHDGAGFIDWVAWNPSEFIALQICGSDWSSHIHKLTEERRAIVTDFLRCPSRKLHLIGWRSLKVKRGGKAIRLVPRIADFFLDAKGELTFLERKEESQ